MLGEDVALYSPLVSFLRRLRTAAPTPARPVTSKSIVVGSGTVFIVPLKLSVALVKPPAKNVTCPLANKLPVAPANKPVPPVTLNITETGWMPFTIG